MLLSWLSKFLASILVSVIFCAGLTLVLDSTVLSSHYIEGQLVKTDSYPRLSTALSQEVAKKSDSTDPQVQAKLQTVLTPQVLQQKTTSALDQMQAYYKGHGPAPVIDLTDLATKAQAAGVPIGDGSGLNKPISISPNNQVKDVAQTFRTIKLATILGSLVLVGLLLLVSWERHKYAALPDVLIVVGVLFLLFAIVFSFAPRFADHFIKLDSSSSAFTSIGRDLAYSIARDLGKHFGLIALLALAVGIGTRVWVPHIHHQVANSVRPKVRAR